MPRYFITEPHPTVKTNSYVHAGRGGAGNIFKAPTTTPATGVPTSPSVSAPTQASTGRFYSGRGGAGNSHSASERTVLSFDEEYGAALAHESAAGGHFGRGGAGNSFVPAGAKSHKSGDDASLRRDSASTTGSTRSGFWGRLSSSSLGHR